MKESFDKWKILHYDTVDSTNEEAKRLAEGGEQRELLVTARRQEKGKGRRGRVWESAPGDTITMSLLLHPEIAPEHASSVTLVMGLAVAAVCRKQFGVDAKIKWPNDVVVNGRKLCGILTEMSVENNAVRYLIIGVGINANGTKFPEELSGTAVSLEQLTGQSVNQTELIEACLEQFDRYYELFLQTEDVSLLMESYNHLLVGKDGAVRVLEPGQEYQGISRGINEKGELLVEKEDGTTEAVYAGEISVRGIYGYV